jgi:hypothetical protein
MMTTFPWFGGLAVLVMGQITRRGARLSKSERS